MSIEQFLGLITVLIAALGSVTGFLTWKTTRRRQVADQMGILVSALQAENKRCEERLERLEQRDEERGRQLAVQAREIDDLKESKEDLTFQVRTLREALRAYRREGGTPPTGMPRPPDL